MWQENPVENSTSWHTLELELLNFLITSFQTHVSFPATASGTSQHLSLKEIRDFMRRHLARISTEFLFGHYTSVHCIIDCLFKTPQYQILCALMDMLSIDNGPQVLVVK